MIEAKHTAEPTSAAMRAAVALSQHGWLVKRKTLRSGAWVGDELVAQVATEIDAATELLDLIAALERIAEWRDIDDSQGSLGAQQHVRDIARAAIAKATTDS